MIAAIAHGPAGDGPQSEKGLWGTRFRSAGSKGGSEARAELAERILAKDTPTRRSRAGLKDLLGRHNFQMILRYAHLAPGHLRAEMLKTEPAAHGQHTTLPERVPADSPLVLEPVSH